MIVNEFGASFQVKTGEETKNGLVTGATFLGLSKELRSRTLLDVSRISVAEELGEKF